jgi:hypothetical protein
MPRPSDSRRVRRSLECVPDAVASSVFYHGGAGSCELQPVLGQLGEQSLGPRDQVLAHEHEFEPDSVGCERAERQVA